MELLSGGTWENLGIDDTTPSPRGDFSQNFQTLKFSHQFSRDAAVEATSSRSDTYSIQPAGDLVGYRRQLQYDAEVLHRFAWADGRLNTTYGTSYRDVLLDSPVLYGSLNAKPYLEVYRGYLHQTAKLTDKITMQGAAALENSSGVGTEPSYQIASIYAPAPEHAFRASYSLAYTHRDLLPAFGDLTLTGGTPLEGNPALNSTPYQFKSYETGYYGTYFDKRLQTDVSLYYTTIDNQHHIAAVPPTFTTLEFMDYDDSIARGAELSLKYHFSRSQWVYANYTYEHITDIAGDLGLETANTPAHKFNIGGATNLGHGLSASVDVGYKDAYFITAESGPGPLAVPAYWRLDARLGYVWPWYKNAELYVSGQNLAVSKHQEFPDGLDVPRTIQGGVSVRFGGKG
jgi:outer membrane receptor for monomeric catechols